MNRTENWDVLREPGQFVPEDSMGYLLRAITLIWAQDIKRHLKHVELTNAHWVPLLKLYWGQASTLTELAHACKVNVGSMKRLIDRLEAKGLCTRVRSESDRRTVKIKITPGGAEIASGIPEILSGVESAYLTGFTENELEAMKEFLRRILKNAQRISKRKRRFPSS